MAYFMRSIFSFVLLQVSYLAALSQTGGGNITAPNAIYFDANLKSSSAQVIPFDKEFTLVITKLPNANVKRIFVYQVKYVNGHRELIKNLNASGWTVDEDEL